MVAQNASLKNYEGIQRLILKNACSRSLFDRVVLVLVLPSEGGWGKKFEFEIFSKFLFFYLGKVKSFRIIIAMRLGALIIFARGGYQIPPPPD